MGKVEKDAKNQVSTDNANQSSYNPDVKIGEALKSIFMRVYKG